MKKRIKSKECKQVLQLLDASEDANYETCLNLVLSENKNVSKIKLEKELNFYI